MKTTTKILFAAAVALAGVTSAQAMPAAQGDEAVATASSVESVAWGCGPGWHPNPWGRCVPNGRPWRRYWRRHW
ncbi:MAG TPA: hypothetical protein VEH76_15135 [Methylocystis sp.]|nr:hypothetical protein [Methylocystis sp.]